MRTEAQIRERLKELQDESRRLRVLVNAYAERVPLDPDGAREYDDIAERKVEVDRDLNLLAWVLGEEK